MSAEATDNDKPGDNTVNLHLADYIIQALIKEDVNAFTESTLLHELLMYKLQDVALPLMVKKVSEISEELKEGKNINLVKAAGGVTTAKRISFRSSDQYNAFVLLFFQAVEDHPELLQPIDSEEMFEKFMIFCIFKFREALENFAVEIAKEKTELEHKNKLYVHRRGFVPDEVPTYADYITERIEKIVSLSD